MSATTNSTPTTVTPSVSISSTANAAVRSLSAGGLRKSNKSVSPKARSRTKNLNEQQSLDATALKLRLNHLFDQIEKEFDALINENAALKDRVDALEEVIITSSGTPPSDSTSTKLLQQKIPSNIKRDSMVAASHLSQKIKSTYKLKTQGRIFNKTQSNMRGTLLEKYEWHKDGVWFVTTCVKDNRLYIGTASADGSACITDVTNSGSITTPHITYTGHEGCSVNCIRFHPKYGLVITASGDSGAHIWAPELQKNSMDEEKSEQVIDETQLIKQPLLRLSGHSSVVISCDWMSTVDQCVTASWDRTADIYDINTGELIVQLAGHDQELTDVEAHSSAPLIVTSSHDTTFRLWDFREAIHSVSVFQGHVDCVTSATFLGTDKVVSGSDDRTVKVWDLKNMRSPLTSIYVEAPINKLGVSQQHNFIAIPLENRHVRLYDCNGNRICRLPRNHHERMVTCVAFAGINAVPLNAIQACPPTLPHNGIQLFTCGFDRKVCHWSIAASDHKS